MGSYDGAKICDIVGLYLLSRLQKLNINIGLYRDDSLAVGPQPPRELNKIKDRICQVFKKNNNNHQSKSKSGWILDLTLDLNTGLYKPFMKPNDTPVYVNKSSNHPPKILKNIPASVNRRLSNTSATKMFSKKPYPPSKTPWKVQGMILKWSMSQGNTGTATITVENVRYCTSHHLILLAARQKLVQLS